MAAVARGRRHGASLDLLFCFACCGSRTGGDVGRSVPERVRGGHRTVGAECSHCRQVQFGWPGLRRREGGEDQGVRVARRSHTPATIQLPGNGATYDYGDRGFLGLALDPNFPAEPWVYGLHTRVHDGYTFNDNCPEENSGGCPADGRLFRFQITPTNTVVAGSEQTLIAGNWCQQFTSHSIGTIEFGPEGELYVGAGDGANYIVADYGQRSGDDVPENPCGDPPVGVGGDQQPVTSQGGALRSQDPRVLGDSATYDGSILRVNPDTGAAFAGNPGGAGDDRIVAYGLRNPFRFTVQPGTGELWIGDVGWSAWEEIDRHQNPTQTVRNFGWPCYEGNGPQSGYDGLNNNICEGLYDSPGAVTAPYFTYQHGQPLAGGCTNSTSSISGMAFYEGGDYPDDYDGALFFSDYSRGLHIRNAAWRQRPTRHQHRPALCHCRCAGAPRDRSRRRPLLC